MDRRAEDDDDKGVVRETGAKAEAPPNRAADRARPAIFIFATFHYSVIVMRGYRVGYFWRIGVDLVSLLSR